MEDRFISPPIDPRHTEKEYLKIERAKRLLTAGEVLTIIHRHLPYRIALKDLGLEHDKGWKTDDPRLAAYKERTSRLEEFLANMGEDMFPTMDEHAWQRYQFNRNGNWCKAISWVFLKDYKYIHVLKLAFG